MIRQVFLVALTALSSSVLTWAIAYFWYRLRLGQSVALQLARAQDEFEQRVRRGVAAAALELMPRLREEVREGFKEALAQSPLSMVEGAARTVGKGADLFGDSLSALLGARPRK